MTATFLVTLDIDEISQLPLIADQIHEDLDKSWSVIKVAPWARPNNPVNPGPGGFTSFQTPQV